jgi:hypothetical protein
MTEEEQAKQEWEKKSDIYGVKDHPYSEGFMDGIDLYQSALKEEIENRKLELLKLGKVTESGIHTSVYASQYFECDKFLKLLTTVTPKN